MSTSRATLRGRATEGSSRRPTGTERGGRMFHGAIVATVTPFRDGKVDSGALRRLVEFQIRNGTDGIVPCGTTGEAPTLSYDEHERVIDLVIRAADRRVP